MEAPLIYKKMSIILEELKAVPKAQKNTQQNFMFRGIDSVYKALNPLLGKHGVFFVPEVLERITRDTQTSKGTHMHGVYLKVKYTFFAEDGSSVECVVAGEALDSGDKATSKAMSIALKYALFQTFCIPTEEEAKNDPDNFSPQAHAPPQNLLPFNIGSACDALRTCKDLAQLQTAFKNLAPKAQAAGHGEELTKVKDEMKTKLSGDTPKGEW